MNKLTNLIILLGCAICILPSCQLDSLSDVKYEPEFAFPLAQVSFTMEDALSQFRDNSVLTVDADGLIRFKYVGDVLTKTTEDVFASINDALGQDIPVALVTDTTALPAAFPDGLNVERMDLKKGTFYYILQSKHPFPVHAEIKALSMVKDGIPLTYNVDIPAYVSGDAITSTNLLFPTDLKGYSIIPNDAGEIVITRTITDSNGDIVNLDLQAVVLQNLEYSYADGYLGNYGYDQDRDTIKIDFFDSWIQGNIYFEDPTITILFENSFGIPTRSVINTFDIITVNGDVLPLESEFISNGIDFPYPAFNEIGEVKKTSFVFNKDNSNIAEILGAGPVALDYDVDALTNPDNDTSITGFVTDSSYYKVQVQVDLPLYGKALNFLAEDTFDINVQSFEKALEGELKIITQNSIPLGALMQGYFIDESGVKLDSLFTETSEIIAPASVDANGFSKESKSAVNYVSLSKSKLEAIKNAKQLIITAAFSTTADGSIPVKITNNQELAIRMGMRVTIQK